jgi:glycosyltransferase involved in cell wall biosynthesis
MTAPSPTQPGAGQAADVTVVIPTYNRAAFLAEALDSILQQQPAPARVVVVNDGSTDHTLEVLAPFAARVEIVTLPNGGKARALNHVLPTISTGFCWFFDDDDAAYPGALALLLQAAHAHPDAPFVFGGWDLATTDGPLATAPKVPVRYAHGGLSAREQTWRLFRECTVMMTGALLRTAAVRRAGGLNNALIRGQDYDLMVRLAAQGDFAFCGQPVYAWRQHGGGRGSAQDRHGAGSRIRVWARSSEPVGRFLREDLPLSAWVDGEENGEAPTTRRLAHFRRAWATGPKQPVLQSLAALAAGIDACPEAALTAAERELVTMSLCHDFVSQRPLRHVMAVMALPASPVTPAVVMSLARGLRWLAHDERQWLLRSRLYVLAGLLAAWAGWLGALRPRRASGA